MIRQHKCPRCHSIIPSTHVFDHAVVCSECGWSASAVREYFIDEQKNSAINALWMTAFAMIFSFVMIASWGTRSLDVVPLKISQWTGKASHADLLKLVEICKERKKADCVRDTYRDITKRFPEASREFFVLGVLLAQDEQYDEAISSLKTYIKKNEKDMEAHYQLAMAYNRKGDFQKATRHFRYLLEKRPKGLEFMTLRSYVDMLVANNYITKAKNLITYYRKKTGHEYLMQKQWKEIKEILRKKRVVAKRK